MGRPLHVKPADAQKKGKNRIFRATKYLFDACVEEAKLFVETIPTSFAEEDLMKKTFRPCRDRKQQISVRVSFSRFEAHANQLLVS